MRESLQGGDGFVAGILKHEKFFIEVLYEFYATDGHE